MNKSDAKQALSIYNKFTQQTEATIDYLNGARNMETDLQMDIPHIEHVRHLIIEPIGGFLTFHIINRPLLHYKHL